MPYEFGDIVLVPFPFTNQAASKKRPAVIVSNLAYNDTRPDVVIMAITSQIHPVAAFGETPVTMWEAAGLLRPSVVKPVFATVERTLVIRQLGALQPADQTGVRRAIAAILS
ncbi:MAG: type II toxin-antitoxin system PemK/MazF family toxin [Stellaceae bacterium]